MKIYESLRERLRTQHQTIEIILSSLDKAHLVVRPQPGKWNILENLAHLGRYQLVFIDRITQILHSVEEPLFERYVAEEDPEFENWRSLPVEALISQIESDRKYIFALITNLTEAAQSRIGIHKKFGRLMVLQWTEFFLLHEAHHIFTIFQLANNTELLSAGGEPRN
jgi:hypothetical protein